MYQVPCEQVQHRLKAYMMALAEDLECMKPGTVRFMVIFTPGILYLTVLYKLHSSPLKCLDRLYIESALSKPTGQRVCVTAAVFTVNIFRKNIFSSDNNSISF